MCVFHEIIICIIVACVCESAALLILANERDHVNYHITFLSLYTFVIILHSLYILKEF